MDPDDEFTLIDYEVNTVTGTPMRVSIHFGVYFPIARNKLSGKYAAMCNQDENTRYYW